MTNTAGFIDTKQRFTVQVKHSFEQLVREAVALHPVLKHLPEQDRINIARCATRHGLLAVRAQSVNDVLDKIDLKDAKKPDPSASSCNCEMPDYCPKFGCIKIAHLE